MRLKLLAVSLLVLFLPLGIYTVRRAYWIEDSPHEFVMLIFSWTMMILLGLTGLVGLFVSTRPSRGPEGSTAEGQREADFEAGAGEDGILGGEYGPEGYGEEFEELYEEGDDPGDDGATPN